MITVQLLVNSDHTSKLGDLIMTYHTALDVSLRSVSICVVEDKGMIHFEGKVASGVDEIFSCLKQFSPDIHSVGFEAGALTR